MWASMATWLTPTVLFCFMNLMVGTIFIASNHNKKHHENDPQNDDSSSRIHRVSSFLERLRSMNYSPYPATAAAADADDSQLRNPFRSKTDDCDSSSRIPLVSSLFERIRSTDISSYTATTVAAVAAVAGSLQRFPARSETDDCSSSSRLAQSIHLPSCFKILRELPTREFLSQRKRRSVSQPVLDSSLLERVEFNLLSFNDTVSVPAESKELNDSHDQLVRVPSRMDRLKTFKSEPENVGFDVDHHVIRSKSEKTGVTPARKSPAVMKKSVSEMKVGSESEEEDVDRRRLATARERRNAADDAKADDFISRFKQQLKLQRLDSLVRFKEMLNRGT